MTNSKMIQAKFDVKCDRCRLLIHAGDDCVVTMDEARGKAYFYHLRCPKACAIQKEKRPVSPARIYKPKFA